MIYWMIFAMILNGVVGDLVTGCLSYSPDEWQQWYSIGRDIQITGFALLAFAICDYNKIEIKAATFFLFIWRVFVTALNLFDLEVFYSPLFLALMTCVYLTWLGKAAKMGVIEEVEPKPGAYYFLLPIHSFWGLLKSVFLPWEMARYESICLIDDGVLWSVHDGRFSCVLADKTNIEKKEGARVYLGDKLKCHQIAKLNSLNGKKCIPGIRDCRKFRKI